MANSIGNMFRITTFGESHGEAIGCIVDGCPANLELSENDIQQQLNRRRPGQGALDTKRSESDTVKILSGTENGRTLGSPIAMLVQNHDRRPDDYNELANIPRPSHADFVYKTKYGILASSGGGRASARETVGRVAAGAVADKYLRDTHGTIIVAWVSSVGAVDCDEVDLNKVLRSDVDSSPVRCPDPMSAEKMIDCIRSVASDRDSIGGIITCVCRNVPAGWGEPVFDKISSALGGAMLSIPAVKGFEIGSGFGAAAKRGSENNDMFIMKNGVLGTVTNRSGGVQGGISNGEPIVMRVAFKPTATIGMPQRTADYNGNLVTLNISKGRHDPCVVPRAVPVVEAMAAIILADMSLMSRS
ncbi:MAG: chorismate synthase [Lentisphaerae bacterium]|nr:chorismate synthase [Lentisphaerota bacterium]